MRIGKITQEHHRISNDLTEEEKKELIYKLMITTEDILQYPGIKNFVSMFR